MTRTIKIVPVLNGFVVHAGCQTVVFESREKLLIELKNYLSNPIGTERQFQVDAVNPDLKEERPIATEPVDRARVNPIPGAPLPYEPPVFTERQG